MLTKGNILKCQLADKLMSTLYDSLNLEHFICPLSLCLSQSQVPASPRLKINLFQFWSLKMLMEMFRFDRHLVFV